MPVKRYKTLETETGIYGFFEKYRPFSNFDGSTFLYDNILWNSAEHAFQASKTKDIVWYSDIKHAETPTKAKALGQRCPLRSDWDKIKYSVMHEIVWSKFVCNPHLQELLLSTGDKYLEETNDWNDRYWGVCNGKGENNLGKILMTVREQLRNMIKSPS